MRYSRQELLKTIGKAGQALLSKKHVVIVGVGALGSVAAELLARAGVGKLTLIDRDCVELHNLQRQSLFTEADIGKPKASCAAAHLRNINSDITVVSRVTDLTYANVALLASDLILDGTDNLATRFLVNEYSVKYNIPWIYASALKDVGYVKAYLPGEVCFACTFTEASGLESCDTAGVLNTITHAIASLQVNEALNLLLGKESTKKLLHLTLNKYALEALVVKKNKTCKVCQREYTYLTGKQEKEVLKFCGSQAYQIRGKQLDLPQLKAKLSKLGNVQDLEQCLHFKTLTLFRDGRVLIKAQNKTEAKTLYAQYIGE